MSLRIYACISLPRCTSVSLHLCRSTFSHICIAATRHICITAALHRCGSTYMHVCPAVDRALKRSLYKQIYTHECAHNHTHLHENIYVRISVTVDLCVQACLSLIVYASRCTRKSVQIYSMYVQFECCLTFYLSISTYTHLQWLHLSASHHIYASGCINRSLAVWRYVCVCISLQLSH